MERKLCVDEIQDTLYLKHRAVKYLLWRESEMGMWFRWRKLDIFCGGTRNDGQYREQYQTVTNYVMLILCHIYFFIYNGNIRYGNTFLCHYDWGTKFDVLIDVIITFTVFMLEQIQKYHQVQLILK
jgi:hypothetical protein